MRGKRIYKTCSICAWCHSISSNRHHVLSPNNQSLKFYDILYKHVLCVLCGGFAVQWVNSLGPNYAIWRQRSGSTLAQVMACCLTAPSHYLNQCWLIIRKAQWYSSEDNFRSDISATNHWNKLENCSYKIHWNLPGANELTSTLLAAGE